MPAAGQHRAPLTRLHLAPSADFPSPWQASIDFGQTTTFRGARSEGGGGSGNQTYHGWVEIGLPGRLALVGILEGNDDPTWGLLDGERYQKEIFAIGGGARFLIASGPRLRMVAEATLARLDLKSDPGLFTTRPGLARTHHLAGSVSLAVGIPVTEAWTVTLAPGVVALPDSVNGLPFYGWSAVLGAGVDGWLAPRLRGFAAWDLPVGPGTNSLDGAFRRRRIPVGSAGLVYHASPRTQVTAYLTNVAGGTPATRLLTQMGEVPLQWGARARYSPTAPESDAPAEAGGSTHAAATEAGVALPPAGTLTTLAAELRATRDREGSHSARLRVGLSREAELELGLARVPGLDAGPALGLRLGDGLHYRLGGKLQLASEGWGQPLTVGARVAVGRDARTLQGYLVAELPMHRRLAPWAALTVAPALLQTGGETPSYLGAAAVLGPPGGVQGVLEPTLHLAGGEGAARRSSWTLALRSPAWRGLRVEGFATTALAPVGVGRFLADPGTIRAGGAVSVRIR